MNPTAFTLKFPGICREMRTRSWVSAACDPSAIWPKVDDLSEIPRDTPLPSGDTIRFREFLALWDTGCMSVSAISDRVIEECGLKPVGPATLTMPVGRIAPRASELYRVNIGLPNHVIVPDLLVVRAQTQDHTEVIIGMDVIRLCDFSITNAGGKTIFSLRIPSLASIDYVEESGGVMVVVGEKIG